ncbi:MAG: hypothetical protein ACYTG1_08495, partial [Planctomycetota bacterium]
MEPSVASSLRRPPRATSFVLLVLLLAVAPRPAAAQGTAGTLPDPISSGELDEYARRLDLSAQQRLAVAELHAEYLREFERLRGGEIAAFLDETRELQQGGRMPQREAMETSMERSRHLLAKIESLDDRLFARFPPVLTDAQHDRLVRVRQARARRRYRAQQMMQMGGGPIVDLSELVLDLELGPEARSAADQVLRSYEAKLTGEMGKLHDATQTLWIDVFDAVEAAGLADASMEDPESMRKMIEVMQSVWGELTARLREKTVAIAELNARTYRALQP